MNSGSLEARDQLELLVERDLLGPWGGPDEELPAGEGPRSRYLIGMVAPINVRNEPELVDSTLGDADDDEGSVDRASPAAAATMFPRSFGLSFSVSESTVSVAVAVSWGRYAKTGSETQKTEQGEARQVWRRRQVSHSVDVLLAEGRQGITNVPWIDQPEIRLIAACYRRTGKWIVELVLINEQKEPEKNRDEAWLFQPQLEVTAMDGHSSIFLAQAEREGPDAAGEEERHLAMLYRDALEFSVGRNVAVLADRRPNEKRAHHLTTVWMPAYEVPQTVAPDFGQEPLLTGLELDMDVLAELPPQQLRAALMPLAAGYEAWLDGQERRLNSDPELKAHEPAGKAAFVDARNASARIRAGIELLTGAGSSAGLDAFRFANRAMALQRVHTEAGRLRAREPQASFEEALTRVDLPANRSWRPFQLAYILLNLPGLTEPTHTERSATYTAVVDLLFFPTGGGKTEAYLGLAAYTFAIRRLQSVVGIGPEARDGGDGVAVLMRYTLRLLTAQQFQRAAALVCACEFLRRELIERGDQRWGEVPFRIGLWVGLAVSPNSYDDAAKQIRSARGQGRGTGNQVLQVLACPWCSAPLNEARDLEPQEDERRVYIFCSDPDGKCPFSRRQSREGLPILTVDEEIYRLMPVMVISTVDKLAQLAWRGQAGMIFGRATRRCSRHGYRHPDLDQRTGCTDTHRKTERLPAASTSDIGPLRPPDLIIQDELHLISGALGTMVGLYETMVEHLCSWTVSGSPVRAKIISSTATVRRAREQVHQLFGGIGLRIFPPPLLDAGDTFFSKQVAVTPESPGRRYRGMCAHGIRLKQAEIRLAETVLTATQYLFDQFGTAADPYLTYVAYFNALRELAGMKRLVDDDISVRVRRGTAKGLSNRWVPMEVQELTSRTPSGRIAETLRQLEVTADPAFDSTAARGIKPKPKRDGSRPIDVLLATSMLQVGVDVSRLGLMVVTGQPKNTAEYIQATSRIGRDPHRPGLAITLYNWARPRDLAHFETFGHYHETAYRRVEPLSVTPFSRRAIDRGLTGVLIGMVREADPTYSANLAAQTVDLHSSATRGVLEAIADRAALVSASNEIADFVRESVQYRLDRWEGRRVHAEAARLGYRSGGDVQGLIRDPSVGPWDEWTVANSLREAEPEINMVLPRGVADPSLGAQPTWSYAAPAAADDPELDVSEGPESATSDLAPDTSTRSPSAG